jgi:hypothetical protein
MSILYILKAGLLSGFFMSTNIACITKPKGIDKFIADMHALILGFNSF